jgi:hypothetical protein
MHQHRRRHGAGLDRRRKAQRLVPVFTDDAETDGSADHGAQGAVNGAAVGDIEPAIGKIANARRKPKPQEMAQTEHVIDRAGRVGVVLADFQRTFVMKQAVQIWGGINGLLFHQMLHGVDIQPPASRFSKSIGHQHALEPELRTKKGAHHLAQHLLTKAAERLRRGDYYCRRLGVHLSWVGDLGGWWDETDFHETRDTGFLLARLEEIWPRVPRNKPLSVGVVLLDLVPADYQQPDLFAADNDRRQKLSPLVDRINDRYGRCAIGFGLFPPDVRAFKGHAAFHRVPESWEF